MTLPRCPRCEFSYGWDGHSCTHCHLPIPTRASWASFASLVRFDYAHPNRDRRKATLLACAFARHVAHLLPPDRANIVQVLDIAESHADGEKTGVARMLRALGLYLRDPAAATIAQNDAGSRAVLAAMHAGQMCASADGDTGFREAAAHARAAAAWAAFPAKAWNTFPLSPRLEHHRPSLSAPPSHEEYLAYRTTDPPRFAAIQELYRASAEYEGRRRDRERDEESAQCRLYREVFGYPFARVEFAAAWRTSTVLALAKQMHESRDFTAMPILADALQDAGCDDDEILEHCRGGRGEPVGGASHQPEHVRGCWVVDSVAGTL